jgi:Fe-S cluster assembly protein SufD
VWRYSRIEELDLDAYSPTAAEVGQEGPPEALAPLLGALDPRAGLVVARDGRLQGLEVDPALAAGGLSVGRLADAPDGAQLLGSVAGSTDALVDLAGAYVVDPLLVRVPAGMVVEAPLVVVHWVGDEGRAVFPRTVVRLEEGAQANVVEVVASPDLEALAVPLAELDVAERAALGYVGLQALGPRVWQIGYQASRVARDGRLSSFAVALGGHYARLRTDSALVGEGAQAALLAAYFGEGSQMHDFRTMQDHHAPRTESELLFKGAVADHARSVYSGLIRIHPGARGTNAFQTNRNLVLSDGAHADSVPNLDIAENDVRCSHASAVGPIDPEQRYYLESRGVPPGVADRLIVLGFFNDILARCPVPALAPPVRDAVAARLGHQGMPAEVGESALPGTTLSAAPTDRGTDGDRGPGADGGDRPGRPAPGTGTEASEATGERSRS